MAVLAAKANALISFRPRGCRLAWLVSRHDLRVVKKCRVRAGIAWSCVDVHNAPTLIYKLLKKPGRTPAFLCLEERVSRNRNPRRRLQNATNACNRRYRYE